MTAPETCESREPLDSGEAQQLQLAAVANSHRR